MFAKKPTRASATGIRVAPTTAKGRENAAASVVDARDADDRINALAAKQHGLVARKQLLEVGLPLHVVDYRVKKGRLRPVHRGVYHVGPLRSRYEREAAAVLACGPTAVLSHRSAAALWKLLSYRSDAVCIEVSAPGGSRALGVAVRVHRIAELPADERTTVEGIAITSAARTILDLAGSIGGRELERAAALAERERLVNRAQLQKLLSRYPRRSGTRALRTLLSQAGGPAFTRSEAESRFLELVRRAQLPAPETNVGLQGFEVDILWRAPRLVVEIDGFSFHSSPRAFERDRRRDAVLAAAGFRVMRVTWAQLVRQPEALLVRLAQALVRTANA